MVKKYLHSEAISLLSRLGQLQPFSINAPMVAAASPSDGALRAIADHLVASKKELNKKVNAFLEKLKDTSEKKFTSAAEAQNSYSILKLRFNDILDQIDIFSDVISQRSEHITGAWIAGLDILASDALLPVNQKYGKTEVMCFLERGHGAAIRRTRTKLPGGDDNPVAIIQIPRERMVASGIASSLVHEVGHQGAALLNLVDSLRQEIHAKTNQVDESLKLPWSLLGKWISEIVADFWSIAHLGITATHGLMGVVSLPTYFVFRIKMDDPHPFPWIRVKLSIEFGKYLFPDEQWAQLESIWKNLYPTDKLEHSKKQIIIQLEKVTSEFVALVANHDSEALEAKKLMDIFPYKSRQPPVLRKMYTAVNKNSSVMDAWSPTFLFAVIGQARTDGRIGSNFENQLLSKYLTKWAIDRAENRGKNYCNLIKQT